MPHTLSGGQRMMSERCEGSVWGINEICQEGVSAAICEKGVSAAEV